MASAAVSRGIFIVGAKRTPFGTFGGKLKDLTPTHLQEVASKAALASAGIKPEQVDSVTIGCCITCAASDTGMISRHAALRIGIPEHVPALTINRLCGSGFQALVTGVQDITTNGARIVLTGGSENMSMSPFIVRGVRFGTQLGVNVPFEDSLWVGLTDLNINTPMGVTAENLAVKYNVTREEADNHAFQSQSRWKQAHEAGNFKDEITPVEVKTRKGKEVVDVDEHPRPKTTMESLAKLPPVFKKNGVVTAGNASGICDGAGAVVAASEEAVKENKLKPLARVVAYSSVGCDPHIMGIGPVNSIKKVCELSGVKLSDVGLVDVNEAFSAQFVSVQKALELDPAKTNVNGGAIALGHPLAASGARIISNLVYEMKRKNVKYAIGSACIGGGQGIAVLLENV